MRVALLQLTSSDNPAENVQTVTRLIDEAAQMGATFVATPEVTNCISLDRDHQRSVLSVEVDDPMLSAVQAKAAEHGVAVLLGSLALQAEPPEDRFANRSFLIANDGSIAARYDKIHMFDVAVTAEETFQESAGFAPGATAILAQAAGARIGMTVCYDVRFAYLYRTLAKAGAQILTVPAAFSPVTGMAHWDVLLRARAIETGCYVIAPAQTGTHTNRGGPQRKTHGHSMIVAPWGEVLLDAGTLPGVYIADIDPDQVDIARTRVPSLTHDRTFEGPV